MMSTTSKKKRTKKKYSKGSGGRDEETGFILVENDDEDEKGVEEVLKFDEPIKTRSRLFYDLDVLWNFRKERKRKGTALWAHIFVWICFVMYGGLAATLALEIVNIGWDNPLFFFIYHLALTVLFAGLSIGTVGAFMGDTLLQDNLRLAAVTMWGMVTNLFSAIFFLIWILTNRSMITDTDYDKDPEANVDYKDVVLVTFFLYITWMFAFFGTYVIRYMFAKFVEVQTMVARELSGTGDILQTLLFRANKRLMQSNEDDDIGISFPTSKDGTLIELSNLSRGRSLSTRKRVKKKKNKGRRDQLSSYSE